jgi:uncharacterized protein (DUF433 family)
VVAAIPTDCCYDDNRNESIGVCPVVNMMTKNDLFAVVERDPEKVGGELIFRGTRVPAAALFENLKDGASIDQFLDWFPGVTRAQVETLAVSHYGGEHHA